MSFDSQSYWERRYVTGGHSGQGSYGERGVRKAELINNILEELKPDSIIEFGCGDGNMLKQLRLPMTYLGIDQSETAVRMCREAFAEDLRKTFFTEAEYGMVPVAATEHYWDLAMSLDVVQHQVEEAQYVAYMTRLFRTAKRFVLIYSKDVDDPQRSGSAGHVRFTKFSTWVSLGWTVERQLEDRPGGKTAVLWRRDPRTNCNQKGG